jgi:hypothetical protein
MLVYTAWYQRTEAKKFVQVYNEHFRLVQVPEFFDRGVKCHRMIQSILPSSCKKALKDEEGITQNNNLPHRQPWTLTHGFYARMGVFVLAAPGPYPDILPEDLMMLTLNLSSSSCYMICTRSSILNQTWMEGLPTRHITYQYDQSCHDPDVHEEASSSQFSSWLVPNTWHFRRFCEREVQSWRTREGRCLSPGFVVLHPMFYPNIAKAADKITWAKHFRSFNLRTLGIYTLVAKALGCWSDWVSSYKRCRRNTRWAYLNQSNYYKVRGQSPPFSILMGLEYLRNRIYGAPFQMFNIKGTLQPRIGTRQGATKYVSFNFLL